MFIRGCKSSWMLTALLLLPSTLSLAAQPHAEQRFQLSLVRGSLASVLRQFAKQTGLQIGTQTNVADSKTDELGPFVGNATADEAITALLTNTDLSYTWQDESTIRIFAKVIRPPRSEDDVHEVLVTGTRLPRTPDEPAPVRVYGRAEVERYGVSSVSDLSRYLTQQPFAFSDGYLHSGAQFLQMRGLGFDTTLLLINGRRVPPSANSISLNAVDLNNIPLSAVDHIEVMSDSAASIYGADAVGGKLRSMTKPRCGCL